MNRIFLSLLVGSWLLLANIFKPENYKDEANTHVIPFALSFGCELISVIDHLQEFPERIALTEHGNDTQER
jgi:hypothetical protein